MINPKLDENHLPILFDISMNIRRVRDITYSFKMSLTSVFLTNVSLLDLEKKLYNS